MWPPIKHHDHELDFICRLSDCLHSIRSDLTGLDWNGAPTRNAATNQVLAWPLVVRSSPVDCFLRRGKGEAAEALAVMAARSEKLHNQNRAMLRKALKGDF